MGITDIRWYLYDYGSEKTLQSSIGSVQYLIGERAYKGCDALLCEPLNTLNSNVISWATELQ
jgi:hypothetical protein